MATVIGRAGLLQVALAGIAHHARILDEAEALLALLAFGRLQLGDVSSNLALSRLKPGVETLARLFAITSSPDRRRAAGKD